MIREHDREEAKRIALKHYCPVKHAEYGSRLGFQRSILEMIENSKRRFHCDDIA